MKGWITVLWMLAAGLLLTGCGSSFEPSASSLYIQSNGKLTEGIVESFEKDYYDAGEFESMVQREIDTYNKSCGEEKISLERLEVLENTMYLTLQYADDETYAAYNETFCTTGTVDEVKGEGFSFDMLFKDPDYQEYEASEATADGNAFAAVLKEEGLVQLERPVKFVSNNVEILSDHLVQIMPIEDDQEYAYIIY